MTQGRRVVCESRQLSNPAVPQVERESGLIPSMRAVEVDRHESVRAPRKRTVDGVNGGQRYSP